MQSCNNGRTGVATHGRETDGFGLEGLRHRQAPMVNLKDDHKQEGNLCLMNRRVDPVLVITTVTTGIQQLNTQIFNWNGWPWSSMNFGNWLHLLKFH